MRIGETLVMESEMAKRLKRNKHEYAIVEGPLPVCEVVCIEVVLNFCDRDLLEDMLEELRAQCAAEITDHFYVSTDFDETCTVLSNRKCPDK